MTRASQPRLAAVLRAVDPVHHGHLEPTRVDAFLDAGAVHLPTVALLPAVSERVRPGNAQAGAGPGGRPLIQNNNTLRGLRPIGGVYCPEHLTTVDDYQAGFAFN